MAQRFDADLTGPLGDPVPIGEDLTMGPRRAGGAPFSVSENGMLAYATSPPSVNRRLGWFDRSGRPVGRPIPFEAFGPVELSPDGTRLAMHRPGGPNPDADIWLFDLARGQPTQFTFTGGPDRRPIWSPDARRLVFSSARQGGPGLYQKPVGGDQPEELLLRSQIVGWEEYWPADWSSQGIVYESGVDGINVDLWLLPLHGDRKPYPLVSEPGIEGDAKVSRDGRWLVYIHQDVTQTSRPEVFVQSLSTTGAKWRISIGGGRSPRWRADGKELFYQGFDGNLNAVPIEATATSLRPGVPAPLFRIGGSGAFAVSPDGQRFLVSSADTEDSTASIVVVSNWPALLKPK
jgi:dipeptidyl aminopeptidase/acylaminoacyl peptidase